MPTVPQTLQQLCRRWRRSAAARQRPSSRLYAFERLEARRLLSAAPTRDFDSDRFGRGDDDRGRFERDKAPLYSFSQGRDPRGGGPDIRWLRAYEDRRDGGRSGGSAEGEPGSASRGGGSSVSRFLESLRGVRELVVLVLPLSNAASRPPTESPAATPIRPPNPTSSDNGTIGSRPTVATPTEPLRATTLDDRLLSSRVALTSWAASSSELASRLPDLHAIQPRILAESAAGHSSSAVEADAWTAPQRVVRTLHRAQEFTVERTTPASDSLDQVLEKWAAATTDENEPGGDSLGLVTAEPQVESPFEATGLDEASWQEALDHWLQGQWDGAPHDAKFEMIGARLSELVDDDGWIELLAADSAEQLDGSPSAMGLEAGPNTLPADLHVATPLDLFHAFDLAGELPAMPLDEFLPGMPAADAGRASGMKAANQPTSDGRGGESQTLRLSATLGTLAMATAAYFAKRRRQATATDELPADFPL